MPPNTEMKTEIEKEPWGWEEYVLLAGVVVGLVAFIAIGVIPAIVYGGFAALSLLSAIIGKGVEPTLGARMFITVGMVLGFVAVGALFATGGAILGLVGVAIGNFGRFIRHLFVPAEKDATGPAPHPA